MSYLQKNLPQLRESMLIFPHWGRKETLQWMILLNAVLDKVFFLGWRSLPRTKRRVFETVRVDNISLVLVSVANENGRTVVRYVSIQGRG